MKIAFWVAIIIISLFIFSSFFIRTYWLFYKLRYIAIGLIIGLIIGYLVGLKRKA